MTAFLVRNPLLEPLSLLRVDIDRDWDPSGLVGLAPGERELDVAGLQWKSVAALQVTVLNSTHNIVSPILEHLHVDPDLEILVCGVWDRRKLRVVGALGPLQLDSLKGSEVLLVSSLLLLSCVSHAMNMEVRKSLTDRVSPRLILEIGRAHV